MSIIALINPDITTFNAFGQTVIDGLAAGALYALLAIALVTAYRAGGQLNFAQGEFATLGAFLVFWILGSGVGIVLAMLGAMALSFVGGAVVERTVIRPSINRSWYSSLVVILGILLTVNALDAVIWGTSDVGGLDVVPHKVWVLVSGSPDLHVTSAMVSSWVALLVLVALLMLGLNRTRLGLAYRAVSSNRESSELVGVSAARIMALGFGASAAIGTIAGVLVSQQFDVLDFNLMLNVLLYAFAAAAIGGFDSIGGAVVGGVIMGVIGAVIPNVFDFVGSGLSPVVAMLTIFVVLLVRPQGLFGSEKVVRA